MESGSYTVPEMSSLEDLVYLTKQDGTTIDQDIEIELRTTGRAGATLGKSQNIHTRYHTSHVVELTVLEISSTVND